MLNDMQNDFFVMESDRLESWKWNDYSICRLISQRMATSILSGPRFEDEETRN